DDPSTGSSARSVPAKAACADGFDIVLTLVRPTGPSNGLEGLHCTAAGQADERCRSPRTSLPFSLTVAAFHWTRRRNSLVLREEPRASATGAQRALLRVRQPRWQERNG